MCDMTQVTESYLELFKTCVEVAAVVQVQVDGFRKWLHKVAAEIDERHELETAVRWASVCNRPLYNRYLHAKKARIRKKYTKKILKWYQAEVAL